MEEIITVLLNCLVLLLRPLMEVIKLLEMLAIYTLGFAFAIVGGHLLINHISRLMRECLDPGLRLTHLWQYIFVGCIERILYISSFLYKYPEFIAFWVFLKVAFPWDRWTGGGRQGRMFFIHTVIGNGLSILFAAVGYGIIHWYKMKTWEYYLWIIIPISLVLVCIAAIIYLRTQFEREHRMKYEQYKKIKKILQEIS